MTSHQSQHSQKNILQKYFSKYHFGLTSRLENHFGANIWGIESYSIRTTNQFVLWLCFAICSFLMFFVFIYSFCGRALCFSLGLDEPLNTSVWFVSWIYKVWLFIMLVWSPTLYVNVLIFIIFANLIESRGLIWVC